MERLGQESLLEVVGSIYEAALDPEQWRPVMHQLGRALRAPICNVYGIDLARQTPLFFQSNDTPQEVVERWTQTYVGQDERIPAIRHWPACTLQTNDTLTERRRFERSALYADFLRPTDSDETLAASLLSQPGANVVVTFNRNGRLGRYEGEELRFMEALLPHLQRAATLSARLSGMGPQQRLRGSEMEALPFGVLVLDAGGRVLECNLSARERLRGADGIRALAGRLRASNPACDAALQLAIATALGARQLGGAIPPALPLTRLKGPPLQAVLVPLPRDPQGFGLREAALAITLFEPWQASAPPLQAAAPTVRPRPRPQRQPEEALTPAQRMGQLELIELLCTSGLGLRALLRSLSRLIQPLLDVQALRFEWRGADGELLDWFCESPELTPQPQQLQIECEGGGRLLLMRAADRPFQDEDMALAGELARRLAPTLRPQDPALQAAAGGSRSQAAGTVLLNEDGSLRFHDLTAAQSLHMIQRNAGDASARGSCSLQQLLERYCPPDLREAAYPGHWGLLRVQRQAGASGGATVISLSQSLPFACHLAQELAALRLPPRQLQVAWRLAQGWTNKRIASETGLALDTVEEYVRLVYRRFAVQDRVGLLLRLAA